MDLLLENYPIYLISLLFEQKKLLLESCSVRCTNSEFHIFYEKLYHLEHPNIVINLYNIWLYNGYINGKSQLQPISSRFRNRA